MDELVPVLLSALLGVGAVLLGLRPRWLVFGVGAVVIGVAATYFSGEYETSPLFVLLDIAQAALAMVVAAWLAERLPARIRDSRRRT